MKYQPHPSGRPWPSPVFGLLFFGGVLLAGWGRIALREREPAERARPGAAEWSATAASVKYDLAPFQGFLSGDEAPLAHSSEFHRGVGLGLYSRDPEFDYGGMITEIAQHNARSVILFLQLYQDNIGSTEIEPAFTPDRWPQVLGRAIDQSRAAGLEVAVMPIVLLRRASKDQWRGRIQPADLGAWFESYSSLILAIARVSAERGASVFCVGSELAALEAERDRWFELIARTREVFPGKLTYSANWDHFTEIPFWDRLDAVSISGYYELTKSTTPTLEELVASWAIHRNRLLSWRRRSGLTAPLWFTEVGYPNLDGAASRPWEYTRRAGPDPAEQAMAYESFMRAWSGQPELGGVWFYQWFGHADPADRGYSPRGKPAARLIQVWYEDF